MRIDPTDPCENLRMTPEKWSDMPDPCCLCKEDRVLMLCILVIAGHCEKCHKEICEPSYD